MALRFGVAQLVTSDVGAVGAKTIYTKRARCQDAATATVRDNGATLVRGNATADQATPPYRSRLANTANAATSATTPTADSTKTSPAAIPSRSTRCGS